MNQQQMYIFPKTLLFFILKSEAKNAPQILKRNTF